MATFNTESRTMRLELRRRFVKRIERAVARIQVDRPPGERLDPRIVANALGGMVDNFSFASFVLGEPLDRNDALRTLDEIWRRTLLLGAVPAATGRYRTISVPVRSELGWDSGLAPRCTAANGSQERCHDIQQLIRKGT